MKSDTERIAIRFDITDKVKKLETDLLGIDNAESVTFDLNGFLDDLHEVIFLVNYKIPCEDGSYFAKKKQFVKDVLSVAERNGLKRTEDSIEDYGNCYYFVMSYGDKWQSEN